MGGWTLQEKLVLLKEVQELDVELSALTEQRQTLEAELAGCQADLDRVQEMVDNLADEMETVQAARRELLRSQEQEDQNILRAETRLPNIKTQKEYVAVLKEIDSAKAVKREVQAQLAARDAELEALGKDRAEKETELQGISEQVASRKAEIDDKMAGFTSRYDEKNQRKQGMLEQVPVPIRKRYQMLLDRRGGIAVVEARKGTCSGCHMQLPPQLYNSLFHMQEIQSCPHCNRLLYVVADQF